MFFISYTTEKEIYLGDADAIGSEQDAFERFNYETEMLSDPATGKIPDHIREKELAFAATLPNDAQSSGAQFKGTTVNWIPRGPWNVGGRTRACAIDVANANSIIAGSASGGMWRSTDFGQTWKQTSTPDQYKSVSCVAQDTRVGHRNVWYYGSGEGYGASATGSGAYYLGNGIFKSLDSGKTWTVLASTTSTSLTTFDVWADIVWNIVTDHVNDSENVVIAAAYGGIYRSKDGGNSWVRVKGNSLSYAYFTDVAISPSGIVYVTLSSDGNQHGIYRSIDGGVTFTNITPANFPAVYNRIRIGISPSDETQVYFLGNTPGYGQANANYLGDVEWNSLWKYTYLNGDGSGTGGNWEDRSLNLPSTGGPFDIFQSQGSYDLVIKVKPDDANTVFIGGTNIYRSTNGFSDTTQTSYIGGYKQGATLPIVLSYQNHHPDQHELIFLPGSSTKMISSNDGGIAFTDDNMGANVTWQTLNHGYLTTMFYSCAMDHAATDNVIIGGAQDNGSWFTKSNVLTDPWVSPRGGDGSHCAIADNKTAFYFSIQNGKVMKAKLNSNGGVDSFARIDPMNGSNYLFINPFVLDPNNNNIMYLAGGKYLWRNDDLSGIPYASNWDSIATNWVMFNDSVPVAGAKITCIAVSKTPANRVYYGTSQRRVFRIDNANLGTPTPIEITGNAGSALFPNNGYVSCIAVDPTNADNIMVTFSNYNIYSVFYSQDGGTTWDKVGGNLEDNSTGSGNGPSIRWARILPVNGGKVYLVGTSVGLFATNQLNGLNTVWVQQGAANIGKSVVTMIDSRQTDGSVIVATHSHGIFSGTILDVNDVVSDVEFVNNFENIKLENYPNPFLENTIIRVELKQRTKTKLYLIDEMGRFVKTIAEEIMEAGEHNFDFHSNSMSHGVYYLVLEVNEKHITRKMMQY